jgi:hypothetical protein
MDAEAELIGPADALRLDRLEAMKSRSWPADDARDCVRLAPLRFVS